MPCKRKIHGDASKGRSLMAQCRARGQVFVPPGHNGDVPTFFPDRVFSHRELQPHDTDTRQV